MYRRLDYVNFDVNDDRSNDYNVDYYNNDDCSDHVYVCRFNDNFDVYDDRSVIRSNF
jgi:hypothetical protein